MRGRRERAGDASAGETVGCVLSRTVEPAGEPGSTLKLVVGHDPRGDWDLIVKANGEQLLRKTIGPETTSLGWTEVSVDLSPYSGQTVKLELVNEPTGWRFEAAHWAEIALQSR